MQRAALGRLGALGLPRGASILDAPCGAGLLAEALRQAGYEALGADIEPAAASRLGSAFRCVDLNGPLPFADASFDLVFSIEGIEHLEGRYACLRELHRVLKPGGTLVLTTPNIVSVRSRVRFFGSGFYHRDARPLREAARHPLHHIALATYADLRYGLHTSGFRIATLGCTHTRWISYAYAWLVPWMWLYTAMAFRKERDPEQRAANRKIRAALFSRSLLFGENLMVTAVRR